MPYGYPSYYGSGYGSELSVFNLKTDVGRVAGGPVAGWDDEVATGVSVSGGTVFSHALSSPDTTGETNPAPEAVYRNCRYELGVTTIDATYSGLIADAVYSFRTHHWSHGGELLNDCTMKCTGNAVEQFSVAMNFALNGVYIQEFSVRADGAGEILLVFEKVVTGCVVNGIDITFESL
jgi:hypothetical protein